MRILFLIILFSLPPAYLIYLIVVYARTKVPYVVTPKKRLPLIIEHMHINSQSVIYDLGCGKADILFAAEKFHPKKLIGFELSPLHVWYAQIKAWVFKSQVQVHCRDFFTVDITEATIIYIFSVQTVVEKMWIKIQKEAKVFVLSNTIPGLQGEYIPSMENNSALPGGLYIYTVGAITPQDK